MPTTSRRLADMFRRFLETEASGAKVLAISTLVALVWANSFGDSYASLWGANLPGWLSFGGRIPDMKHLVNDGFMSLFFLVVGLEIKRELVSGELNTWRSASLPVIAAVGGMVVPALIYLALNAGTGTENGWAIPTATDIAFAVAVLAAFGSRVPNGLKVFLLSLAIVDDIGAIAIIVIFYGHSLELVWLAGMAAIVVTLLVVGRGRVIRGPVLLVVGLAMWTCAVLAGIHPAIAGVALAMTLSVRDEEGPSLEDRIHPWTSLLIVPAFALANAGVAISAAAFRDVVASALGAGIIGGLVIGKVVGISSFSWLAVKTGVSAMPEGVRWAGIVAASAAAGIGFTVSLFISDLAFGDEALVDAAKLSVFAGSLLSAAVASVVLARIGSRN